MRREVPVALPAEKGCGDQLMVLGIAYNIRRNRSNGPDRSGPVPTAEGEGFKPAPLRVVWSRLVGADLCVCPGLTRRAGSALVSPALVPRAGSALVSPALVPRAGSALVSPALVPRAGSALVSPAVRHGGPWSHPPWSPAPPGLPWSHPPSATADPGLTRPGPPRRTPVSPASARLPCSYLCLPHPRN